MDKKIKKSVLEILSSTGLLSENHVKDIQSKENHLYARLLKSGGHIRF